MLSRVANNLYWLSRYIERAENLARLVNVCRYDALDLEGSEVEESDALWKPLLCATSLEESYANEREASSQPIDVSWYITFSANNPDSIRQCIGQARENARMVRDQISEEMWLELNSFHLFMRSSRGEELWASQPEEFYRRTIQFCMLFAGLIQDTILRDEGWHFVQVGKFLERADKTTRILDMLAYQDRPDRTKLASALRSCSGFSAFRGEFRGEISLQNVIGFLLFSQSFPRSVRFAIRELDQQIHAISGTLAGAFSNEVERLTGNVLAQLNFSNVNNVWAEGHHQYIDNLQQQFNLIGKGIFETYVLLPSEINSLTRLDSWEWQQQQQQQQ